jgi:outer membrane protein
VKNVSLVLNLVLVVAVGVLFYLHFSSKNVASNTEEALTGAPKSKAVIAYINSDSLLNNYAFSKDIQEQLKTMEGKYEAEFANRAKGLENEFATFQRNAQSMTINQARAQEEELMKKRNNLLQYQEALGQKLMQEQAKLNEELYENVATYLKEYGQKENLDVVLTYSKGSGVLYASDSLDITRAVIAGLNDRHKAASSASPEAGKEVVKSSAAPKK